MLQDINIALHFLLVEEEWRFLVNEAYVPVAVGNTFKLDFRIQYWFLNSPFNSEYKANLLISYWESSCNLIWLNQGFDSICHTYPIWQYVADSFRLQNPAEIHNFTILLILHVLTSLYIILAQTNYPLFLISIFSLRVTLFHQWLCNFSRVSHIVFPSVSHLPHTFYIYILGGRKSIHILLHSTGRESMLLGSNCQAFVNAH